MDFQTAKLHFERLFENRMETEEARTFLIDLYTQGETPESIAAAVEVMKSHAVKLNVTPELQPKLIDIVGTGGDCSGTFNVSSTAALLLASMGCFVAKHGNRSITSNSGSADMLEALGIQLNHTPKQQATMLEACGFAFLFAQNHHPAMKHIMPIRKSISHRTIFNLLGPLTNPANVTRQFVGVYDQAFIEPLAEVLKRTGSVASLVASSFDGMDELSIAAPSAITELKDGTLKSYELDPQTLGIPHAPLEAIKGGDGVMNARIAHEILTNQEKGAKRDMVVLNAAAALITEGRARDFKEGLEMGYETLESGQAAKGLAHIIKTSNAL